MMVPAGSAMVDPACAICIAPAGERCGCEANALELAIAQAEDRYFKPTCIDVRSWVRRRARDYILAYFHLISEPCKDAHSVYLNMIQATSFAHYNAPPTPAQYAYAEAEYRRNINRAWSIAVKRYPEVLDYFYSLVHVTLPDDDDPSVIAPPMDRLNDLRGTQRRVLVGPRHEPAAPRFPMPPMAGAGLPPHPVPPMPPHPVPWPTPPPSPHMFPPGCGLMP